jgi:hypothetical protein
MGVFLHAQTHRPIISCRGDLMCQDLQGESDLSGSTTVNNKGLISSFKGLIQSCKVKGTLRVGSVRALIPEGIKQDAA